MYYVAILIIVIYYCFKLFTAWINSWATLDAWSIYRAILRLILVLKHEDGIQLHPTITPLKRDSKVLSPPKNKKGVKDDKPDQELPVWKGERSGRFVRSLSAGNNQFKRLISTKIIILTWLLHLWLVLHDDI